MTKKTKRYVIAKGYPWYVWDPKTGYTRLAVKDAPNNTGKPVEFKLKWGAWKKVRILIEEVK